MPSLADLWLPILLAAVGVFLVSSILHVALPWHRGDLVKMPDEGGVLEAMRKVALKPGMYFFPGCDSMAEMQTDEMKAKYAKGPVGSLIVRPNGMPSMGASLGIWFAQTLIVSLIVAYLGTITLVKGADYSQVQRLTGTAAFLAYAFSHFQEATWKGASWSVTSKFALDGLIYAFVTAGVFGSMWPEVA